MNNCFSKQTGLLAVAELVDRKHPTNNEAVARACKVVIMFSACVFVCFIPLDGLHSDLQVAADCRLGPGWAAVCGRGFRYRSCCLHCTVLCCSAAVTAGPGGLLHLQLGLRALLLWRPLPLLAGDAAAAPPALRRAARRLQANN